MRTKASSKSGFTLIELIVILVVIAILGAIAIPKMVQARAAKFRNSCIGNLKWMESGKRSWSVESKQLSTAIPADSDLFGGTLYIRAKPFFPSAARTH